MTTQLIVWLLLLMPQTITSGTVSEGVLNNDALEPLSITVSDCETTCTAAWAAADTNEPFEMSADDPRLVVGDTCRCWGPGPKLRYDGSQP